MYILHPWGLWYSNAPPSTANVRGNSHDPPDIHVTPLANSDTHPNPCPERSLR